MDLRVSLGVVLPLVCYMVIGRLCRFAGFLDPVTSAKMNGFNFQILMSCAMFNNILKAKDSFSSETMGFVLFFLAFTVADYLLLELTVPRAVKDPARCGSYIQGCFRGNMVLFGSVVLENLLPGDWTAIGNATVVMSVVVPASSVLATILFERRKEGEKTGTLSLVRRMFANPTLDSALLGFAVVLLGIKLPDPVLTAVNGLAACASPLALVVIGAELDLTMKKRDAFQLYSVCLIKLVVNPLIALLLTRALGFSDSYAIVTVILLSVPVAISSYPFAVKLGGDGPFAASVVAYTTVLSIFTVVGWVTVLQLMGLV